MISAKQIKTLELPVTYCPWNFNSIRLHFSPFIKEDAIYILGEISLIKYNIKEVHLKTLMALVRSCWMEEPLQILTGYAWVYNSGKAIT